MWKILHKGPSLNSKACQTQDILSNPHLSVQYRPDNTLWPPLAPNLHPPFTIYIAHPLSDLWIPKLLIWSVSQSSCNHIEVNKSMDLTVHLHLKIQIPEQCWPDWAWWPAGPKCCWRGCPASLSPLCVVLVSACEMEDRKLARARDTSGN